VTTDKLAGMAATVKQKQQRVAVGPGNEHFISVHQASSDAATMQRATCGHVAQWPMRPRFYAAAAAGDLLCVGKLFFMINYY